MSVSNGRRGALGWLAAVARSVGDAVRGRPYDYTEGSIRHAILGVAGTSLDLITDISSHPHATAQCREYLARAVPSARVHAANSTAEAARDVAALGDLAWAAIGTELAGKLYGLAVLAADIEDRPENATRFVLLGKERTAPTGTDKTSVVCFIEKDRPGSLLAILHEFSEERILSRAYQEYVHGRSRAGSAAGTGPA